MRLPVFPTTEFLFHADRFRQISRDSAGLVQSVHSGPGCAVRLFDEKQTDGTVKRLDVGEIRQGVFTFASSWKAHAAQAEISGRIKDLARVDSTPEDSVGIDMYDLFSEPMAAVKPAVSAPARTTENSLLDLRPVLAALWLTAMAGKPGCEDAARFCPSSRRFSANSRRQQTNRPQRLKPSAKS